MKAFKFICFLCVCLTSLNFISLSNAQKVTLTKETTRDSEKIIRQLVSDFQNVIGADGKISEKERLKIKGIIEKYFDLNRIYKSIIGKKEFKKLGVRQKKYFKLMDDYFYETVTSKLILETLSQYLKKDSEWAIKYKAYHRNGKNIVKMFFKNSNASVAQDEVEWSFRKADKIYDFKANGISRIITARDEFKSMINAEKDKWLNALEEKVNKLKGK